MSDKFKSNTVNALLLKYNSDIEKYQALINKELDKSNQSEDFLEKLNEYV